MPKGSPELVRSRCEEIVDACAELYETMSFKDISIKLIGEKTSFSRPSIYNYFETKEEIFLAILKREHEAWILELKKLKKDHENISKNDFADILAKALKKRLTMLKLLAMNLYDIEAKSRKTNLVEFKKVYAASMEALAKCLRKFFPKMSEDDIKEFLYIFYPFMFGVYPYAVADDRQKEAMDEAGIAYAPYELEEITRLFVIKLLGPFENS